MAAVNNTGLVMEVEPQDGDLNADSNVNEITGAINSQDGIGMTDEDILTEALVDAPGTFSDSVQLQYTMPDENGASLQETALLDQSEEQVSLNEEGSNQLSHTFTPENFIDNGISDVNYIHTTSVQESGPVGTLLEANVNNVVSDTIHENTQPLNNSTQTVTNVISQPTIMLTRAQPPNPAPLGSSQNPIRIIQQGNQYTPVQQLSKDQLQQIMHVVQQQQLAKNPGSSVLYNSQTNTKIVYRVIYPSQLHRDGEGSAQATNQQSHTLAKRAYKKRVKDEDLEKLEGPELSKEEKEMRKKMRPKTRSGRVSKPPKHMVKDFKHIHVLDYDEDYDDSDGGYSDFKYSEEEDGEPPARKDDDENFVAYGLDTNKPKNWKCITCGKCYIGRAGLGRHLRLYPSHGNMDPEGEGEMEPPDPSVFPVEENIPVNQNGNCSTANSTGSFSEDSRDSTLSLTNNQTPRLRGGQRGRPRGSRSGWRGRGAYKTDPETRRRSRLKEAARECTDEELMEIVLPRLAKVITLWEFLVMKVEKGNPAWPHADDIYREYERLHEHVKKLCQEYLQYLPEPQTEKHPSLFKVDNPEVATALGLKVGCHQVKDISESDTAVNNRLRFLTTSSAAYYDATSSPNKPVLKRSVTITSPNISPAKKPKIVVSPGKNKMHGTVQKIVTNTAFNKLPQASNVESSVGLSSVSNIQVINAPSVSDTLVASSISGKNVSLLSNSLSPKLLSHSSLSSVTSPSPTSSQKVIYVSGKNQSNASSVVSLSNSHSTVKETLSSLRTNDKSNQLIAPNPVGTHFIAISSAPSLTPQNRLLVHNSDTGTYSFVDLSNTIQNVQTSNVKMNNVSQPVLIKLPQASTGNAAFLQPKLVLNENNVLNSASTDSSSLVTNVVSATEIQHVLTVPDQQVTPVSNVVDTSDQNIMLSYQNVESHSSVNNSDIPSDVVYTFASDGDVNPQDHVVLVDPESMFLNDQVNEDMLTEDENSETCTQVLLSNGTEEVGVISSVDNDGAVRLKTEIPSDESEINEGVNVKTPMEDLVKNEQNVTSSIVDSEIKSELETYDSLEAQENEQNAVHQGGTQQIETFQIPASNIYQTEDGLIFIQNADGTTLQLQGTDGQAVSMETVQALLGIEAETQYVTEVNP